MARLIASVGLCSPNNQREGALVVDDFEIPVRELKARLDGGEEPLLLDVREQYEHEIVNLRGILIPLGHLPMRLDELDPTCEIIVYCHHGNRSLYAAEFLKTRGFDRVRSLAGGIDAWAREIDPTMPLY